MILTLMKVPVQLINLTVCLLGGMVYAPSYAYFFLTQVKPFTSRSSSSVRHSIPRSSSTRSPGCLA